MSCSESLRYISAYASLVIGVPCLLVLEYGIIVFSFMLLRTRLRGLDFGFLLVWFEELPWRVVGDLH